MHPINKLLSHVGLQISKSQTGIKVPKDFRLKYIEQYALLKEREDYSVFEEFRYEAGSHPLSYVDFECSFAASHLAEIKPSTLLDIGSYRHFILGLLVNSKVTTIDVRKREPVSSNETVLNGDANRIDIPLNAFDAVLSLCAVEHFGLGRYGDEFDLDADKKVFQKMKEAIKPGGSLVFTTLINRAAPFIGFNAHRIYTIDMIRAFCDGLTVKDEKYYSFRMDRFCDFDEVTSLSKQFDIYCGFWGKPDGKI